MTAPSELTKVKNYAESEGGMWDSDGSKLLDPAVVEPRMYRASPDSESGWGFHRRAELLNGRLAMLGFVIGLLVEALSGQGILHQIGLGALLN
ncbi:chlorophyll a/b-binding protein [Synechococcus sp. BSF8S]|uniref:chlorophyll a/b-binding protein n=2 Tax=Cyanophyceae TaxID=3028117 RepID=UPI00351C1683